jgi:hypothetical protein
MPASASCSSRHCSRNVAHDSKQRSHFRVRSERESAVIILIIEYAEPFPAKETIVRQDLPHQPSVVLWRKQLGQTACQEEVSTVQTAAGVPWRAKRRSMRSILAESLYAVTQAC